MKMFDVPFKVTFSGKLKVLAETLEEALNEAKDKDLEYEVNGDSMVVDSNTFWVDLTDDAVIVFEGPATESLDSKEDHPEWDEVEMADKAP